MATSKKTKKKKALCKGHLETKSRIIGPPLETNSRSASASIAECDQPQQRTGNTVKIRKTEITVESFEVKDRLASFSFCFAFLTARAKVFEYYGAVATAHHKDSQVIIAVHHPRKTKRRTR